MENMLNYSGMKKTTPQKLPPREEMERSAAATNIFQTVASLKGRLEQPKVYAITLERENPVGHGIAVNCIVAFDLEEAIVKAKEVLVDQLKMPVEEAQGWRLGLFTRKTVQEIVREASTLSIVESKVVPDSGISEKNKLMRRIVEKKDSRLLNRSKGQFTAEEIAYLKERLD